MLEPDTSSVREQQQSAPSRTTTARPRPATSANLGKLRSRRGLPPLGVTIPADDLMSRRRARNDDDDNDDNDDDDDPTSALLSPVAWQERAIARALEAIGRSLDRIDGGMKTDGSEGSV